MRYGGLNTQFSLVSPRPTTPGPLPQGPELWTLGGEAPGELSPGVQSSGPWGRGPMGRAHGLGPWPRPHPPHPTGGGPTPPHPTDGGPTPRAAPPRGRASPPRGRTTPPWYSDPPQTMKGLRVVRFPFFDVLLLGVGLGTPFSSWISLGHRHQPLASVSCFTGIPLTDCYNDDTCIVFVSRLSDTKGYTSIPLHRRS